jgi:DNA-binding CsgD family transcriptional regulator
MATSSGRVVPPAASLLPSRHLSRTAITAKQVAARLGVSPATAHEYVTALYRRFGVHGRGELPALARRRAG